MEDMDMRYYIQWILCLFFLIASINVFAQSDTRKIAILTYHNFNPTVPGSMSLTPERFETQLKWLKEKGYTVIPLKDLVSYLQGKNIVLPAKSVVITADDGWESVYTYMLPLVRKYQIPVTLFIYPSTISEGTHAMTWDQLKELQNTGLFDIQSHTETHPNFKQEKRHRSAESYAKFVNFELVHSKQVLEEKLGKKMTLLAWPFGIYDEYLEQQAAKAGYEMAFTIDYRKAARYEKAMAQPRYMIVVSEDMKTFAGIVG
jgi:peptidoglycan/xylan/chitin deacetylase (PgdA/CDA1 family)